MITDALLRLSDAQSVIIASGAEAESTNIIDLGAEVVGGTTIARSVGEGEPAYIVASFSSALAGAGASLTITVETHTAADFGTAKTVRASTGPISVANLVGKQVAIPLPRIAGNSGERYMAVRYAATGANVTAGTVTTDIVLDVQDTGKYYASGFTV